MTYVRPTGSPAVLVLPPVPDRYDPDTETERNRILVAADGQNLKGNTDVVLTGVISGSTRKDLRPRLILLASDGTRWQIKVSTAGVLSTGAV